MGAKGWSLRGLLTFQMRGFTKSERFQRELISNNKRIFVFSLHLNDHKLLRYINKNWFESSKQLLVLFSFGREKKIACVRREAYTEIMSCSFLFLNRMSSLLFHMYSCSNLWSIIQKMFEYEEKKWK